MKKIDDATFDQIVLSSTRPVLVDFTAEWCPPCKLLKPILQRFADDHPELDVVYIDTDESPGAGARFGVTAMPTLMLFDGGEVKAKTLGLQNAARISAFVAEALA